MTLEHFDTLFAFVVILAGVSLLVTVLVQMVSAFLALRGSNLRWGLKTLLAHADPELAKHAKAIAEKVLHHPLISDSTFSKASGLLSRWRLASAIRKEELVEILRCFAQPSRPGEPAKALEPWEAALHQAFDTLTPESAAKLTDAVPKLKQIFGDDCALSERVLAPLLDAAELPAQIDRWFDSVMDRTAQRFVMHTRLWTVIFSFVLAFALHLDAFRLLTQLSTDAELRARLVASADVLTRKADEVLPPATAAATHLAAMKELIRAHPKELGALPEPAGFTDLDGAKAWLTAELQTAGISDAKPWLTQYESTLAQEPLRTSAANLRSILDDKLKFQLIPDPYPQPFYNYWTPSWLHLWGVIASAALLSLGAPFWFNMLKTLSNLRPVVAHKEKQESAPPKAD
jgi:hypothetical protein